MPITRTNIVDDDGSGTTGTVINNAWKQELYNQIDGLAGTFNPSAWTAVPFNAGNFGAAGSMVWTVEAGDVLQNRYLLQGKTLFWSVYLFTTSLSGTASAQLRINLPIAGANAATTRYLMPVGYIGDGGSNVSGYVETAAATYIGISKTNLANFTIAANNLHVAFTTYFEVL